MNLRLALMAVALLAAACGEDDPDVATRSEQSTTSTPNATTSTTTARSTTPCRNSYDPDCGPFRWDPEPVNRPMSIEVTYEPRAPKAGQEVTFTVRVRDDGPLSPGSCTNTQDFGWYPPDQEARTGVCTAACIAPRQKYGPWDPPPPENDSITETFRHTYGQAGSYTARFGYNIGEDCNFSPYKSRGENSVTIGVAAS